VTQEFFGRRNPSHASNLISWFLAQIERGHNLSLMHVTFFGIVSA